MTLRRNEPLPNGEMWCSPMNDFPPGPLCWSHRIACPRPLLMPPNSNLSFDMLPAHTYHIEVDLLMTCNLLQTLLQKTNSSEEAVRDKAVRQVAEMINEALKVFLRSTPPSVTDLYRASAKGTGS